MDMRVKFLKTGTYNASLVTGGPYITGVKGEEKLVEHGCAAILHGWGVLEILGPVAKAEDRETKESRETDLKDMTKAELAAFALEKYDVKLDGRNSIESLIADINELAEQS